MTVTHTRGLRPRCGDDETHAANYLPRLRSSFRFIARAFPADIIHQIPVCNQKARMEASGWSAKRIRMGKEPADTKVLLVAAQG